MGSQPAARSPLLRRASIVMTDSLRLGSLRYAAAASSAEQFCLWSIRLWWRAFPELQVAWGDFLHGFRVCGVSAAVESCHRFCAVVLASGDAGGGIACLHFPLVLPKEEQLLAALGAGASGHLACVERALREVVSPEVANTAAPFAVRFAQILAEGGLKWQGPPSSWDIARAKRVELERMPMGSAQIH
jgi:hypothetical protein